MKSEAPISRSLWALISIVTGLTLTLIFALVVTPPTPAGAAPDTATVFATATDDVTPLPDVTETGGTMGTCYAFYEISGQELPEMAAAAGSRWDRFDFRWNVIEGEEARLSSLSFGPHDEIVDRDLAYDIDIIGILGSTPKWAAPTCPVMAGAASQTVGPEGAPLFPMALDDAYWWRPCPPTGLDLPWNHPDNVWGNYVHETVTHFKGRVHVWEIWNEPDLGQLFWSGTPAQYAQLLKVGYQAVKAADPDATVLFAGLAYWSNPSYYVSILDELKALDGAADNDHYFDAMSLHLYSNVYQIRDVATEIQVNMASRVGPHPIWLTETGVPLWDEWPDGTPESLRINRATAAEAASYVIEAFAEARAIGIERFLFFRNHDDYMSLHGTDLHEYFGLIRNDLSLRPSYVAFQVAAQYLYGENQISGPFSGDGVRRITFWGTPRGRIDVLWNETGTTLAYSHTALLPSATVVDVQGITQTVTATDSVLPLTLEPATANTAADGSFLIGGPPLLVIHEDTSAPQSALRPLPATVYSDALRLTWDVTDEGAGYWYSEIERATAPDGPWGKIAGWPATQRVTETLVGVSQAGTWYLRSRARDNVGNWEAWPGTAEVSTTLFLTRTVGLSVTAYIDADGSGAWDAGEPAASGAALTWRHSDGTVISSTVGATWEVTETVDAGDYTVSGSVPDYIAAPRTFTVIPAETPRRVEITLGFKEIRGWAYLPLVMRAP